MKTDAQLKADVTAELVWEPAVNATNIGVAVMDGVVSLNGQVDTLAEKQAVERAVRRIAGVRAIALDVDVKLTPDNKRSDSEIAQAAAHALRWHSLVPEEKVQVEVDDGWVTLTGEVDWAYQLASAEQCIHPLIGVRGITNKIALKSHASAKDIQDGIAAAFARHAGREAKHVSIEVDGSVVTLSGKVDSLREHEAAIGTAYAARGVTRVVDKLEVGSS